MPDGKSLLVLSDETSELEYVKLPIDGIGEGEALTDDGAVLRFRGYPSPDGKQVAYWDNNKDFWVLNLESKEQKLVSTSRDSIEDFGNVAWSPDSRWIAFSMVAPNTYYRLWLHDVEGGSNTPITTDRVSTS